MFLAGPRDNLGGPWDLRGSSKSPKIDFLSQKEVPKILRQFLCGRPVFACPIFITAPDDDHHHHHHHHHKFIISITMLLMLMPTAAAAAAADDDDQ